MADIQVEAAGRTGERLVFDVVVEEPGSASRHRVTLSPDDLAGLAGEGETAEELVRRCFDFLLEREPKESILATFDVSVIERYFPDFRDRISGGG
jgi:hypothetical protein